MYHPTSRVLTVLELLQSQPNITGPKLAASLEVDVRTVRRYVTMLQEMGIPVEANTGRYGGYRLRPGFKLPPLMLNEEEALALTLGLMAAKRLGLAATGLAIEGALSKVERVLPAEVRQRVNAVQETLILDLPPTEVTVASRILTTLSKAVQQAQQVKMSYRSRDNGTSERLFDPYSIVCHGGRWYTAGYCHLRQDLRVFRLDRVESVEALVAHFSRPADFDGLKFILESFAAIPDKWDVEVLLKCDFEEASRKVMPSLALLEPAPGGTLFRSAFNDLDWMARYLVSLGCDLEIRQPQELREAFRRLAEEILSMAH
ncbi:MAG TPA: YafY family protein [Chloroflexia bacterium]|nr:YafY family protein [Chloroflexia bacterium]